MESNVSDGNIFILLYKLMPFRMQKCYNTSAWNFDWIPANGCLLNAVSTYCHVYVWSDSRRGFGLDITHLLPIYTHNSKLQVITEPALISALYKTPQYT
jgi:hypothetical protein